MSAIGKRIPSWIKKPIIKIINLPSKMNAKLYQAASRGRIYVPDKLFLKWQHRVYLREKLNLKKPVTYQEKIQWLKLYYRKPEFTMMVDKYAVRDYVRSKIGEDALIPLYGVFDRWEQIDFDKLPERFVIKCTHDSGSVVICQDKKTFAYKTAQEKIEAGLARNQYYLSREWPYKNVKPRIIIEEFLDSPGLSCPVDYKCYCFNGTVKFILACTDRNEAAGTCFNYMDTAWNELNISSEKRSEKMIDKPCNLDMMIKYSELFSKELPLLRVDFYEIDNKLYFGELTFFPGGGRWHWKDKETDRLLGSWIGLPEKSK